MGAGGEFCGGSELRSYDAAVAFLGQAASGAARHVHIRTKRGVGSPATSGAGSASAACCSPRSRSNTICAMPGSAPPSRIIFMATTLRRARLLCRCCPAMRIRSSPSSCRRDRRSPSVRMAGQHCICPEDSPFACCGKLHARDRRRPAWTAPRSHSVSERIETFVTRLPLPVGVGRAAADIFPPWRNPG